MVIILLTMELMDVGCNTLSKAAMAKGMSSSIFTTYTHGIAFFFLIPLSFLFHRKTPSPHISVAMIFRLFLLGVLCSPTLASAMNNLSPAFTFIMGIIFRMEVLNLRAQSSLLKSLGTLVSIGGAFIVTLYQGMPINIFSSSPTQFSLHSLLNANETQPNWALGGLYLFGSSIFLSLTYVTKLGAWGVLVFLLVASRGRDGGWWCGDGVGVCCYEEGKVLLRGSRNCEGVWACVGFDRVEAVSNGVVLVFGMREATWIARDFHSEILITLISFFFETIVAAIVTFLAEDDTSVWTPSINIVWIAILFGALEVGVVNTVQTWACGKKGPLFVAMFKPLQMIIAVVMGVSFLGDILHLGSLIGGTVIAIGFYTVMKGKAEEESEKEVVENRLTYSSEEEDSASHKEPLLQNIMNV
uniref:WAT1-related protein n=1 Tax=Chenopodium quinoa TaxID=63459 RepID=A0A803L0E5_CHEQI